jgi:hypothetical protein
MCVWGVERTGHKIGICMGRGGDSHKTLRFKNLMWVIGPRWFKDYSQKNSSGFKTLCGGI